MATIVLLGKTATYQATGAYAIVTITQSTNAGITVQVDLVGPPVQTKVAFFNITSIAALDEIVAAWSGLRGYLTNAL